MKNLNYNICFNNVYLKNYSEHKNPQIIPLLSNTDSLIRFKVSYKCSVKKHNNFMYLD